MDVNALVIKKEKTRRNCVSCMHSPSILECIKESSSENFDYRANEQLLIIVDFYFDLRQIW